jgi:hypothetical protein
MATAEEYSVIVIFCFLQELARHGFAAVNADTEILEARYLFIKDIWR